ncbi:MAG: DUF1707 SHOCT-like domain-containing protein [Solirubrobacteraceae bacterium]
MARRSNLRASDADREQIAERLRKATAEGRLLAEELEQRIGATFSARTYGELDALVADLPDDRLAAPRPRSMVRLGSPLGAVAITLVAVVVVAIAALVITGTIVAGGAWILFGAWFLGCRGSRCHSRYGRQPQSRGWQQVSGPADRQAWL